MYGYREVLAALIATISVFSDGQQFGWFAPTVPLLLSEDSPLKLTENNISWLETFYFIGGAIGISTIFFLVSAIGRKYSVAASSSINLLSWITTAFATNFIFLCIAKILAGIAAIMAFVAVPMYIAEIASKQIRGILLIFITASYYLGNLTIYAIAPFTPLYIPPVINVLLLLFQLSIFTLLPESPYYLISKKRSAIAEKTLNTLRRTTNICTELEEISAAVTRQQSERGRLVDLFLIKSNRKALFLVILSTSAPQFAGFSVITINVHIILSAANSAAINPNIGTIIFSIITLLAAVLCSFSIDKFGRRLLVIVSCIGCGISFFIIAIYFNLKSCGYKVDSVSWIPLVALILYTIAFMFGLGSIKILTSELFSMKMKAIGAATAEVLYLVFGLLTLKLYDELSSCYGHHVSLYTFGSFCFIAAVLYIAFLPETKNKTLEEIQLILKNQHKAVPTELL